MDIKDLLNKKDYTILDNVFSNDLIDETYNQLIHKDFSYNLNQSTVDNKRYFHSNILDYPQFTHCFYNYVLDSDKVEKVSSYNIADNILKQFIKKYNLQPLHLMRVKVNLNTQNSVATKDNFSEPHIDNEKVNHLSMIYYVNKSDGDTFIFDKDLNIIKRVSPIPGRLLLMKGHVIHSAGYPINTLYRIVINFNFELL